MAGTDTPGLFRALIVEAFIRQMKEDCTGITDDAMVVVEAEMVKAHMVMGSYANIKITRRLRTFYGRSAEKSPLCR